MTALQHEQSSSNSSPHAALWLGALGVVYGDIGTSPLYTIRAALSRMPTHTDQDILGLLSLLFWLLMIVVSLKYVTIVLRADTRGEGGTMDVRTRGWKRREGWRGRGGP